MLAPSRGDKINVLSRAYSSFKWLSSLLKISVTVQFKSVLWQLQFHNKNFINYALIALMPNDE